MSNLSFVNMSLPLLIAFLTDMPENLWVLDRDNSQDDIEFTNLIFNHVDDSDCVTVQLIDGEVHIDSLRNDTLFDGSLSDLHELYNQCIRDEAA